MKIELWRQWEIRTADGKVKKLRKRKCGSYVLAMADILLVQMDYATYSIPDTGNTSRSVGVNAANLRCDAAAIDDANGLVVGTGTNAVALADYALQTKIAHGTGSGQLQYGVVSIVGQVTSGTTRRLTVARPFTNSSGASITVSETGIYAYGSGTSWNFCIVRDLESPGVAIANAATATLTYTIGVTV